MSGRMGEGAERCTEAWFHLREEIRVVASLRTRRGAGGTPSKDKAA
jgi:hypothetical protein